jgi:hypothetical protein
VIILAHYLATAILLSLPITVYGLITGHWKWEAIQGLAMIGTLLGTLAYMGDPFLPDPYSFAGGDD